MTEFLDVCEQVARNCGQVLLDMRGTIRSHQKAPKDLVTEADFASQELARRLCSNAFPDHRFLGEESDEEPVTSALASSRPASPSTVGSWIPWTARSITCVSSRTTRYPWPCDAADEILVGTVYDPVLDECFSAAAGHGAFLNGVPIHTSGCQVMEQALVAASLPTEVPRNSPEVSRFIEVMHAAQAIRRLGSAALSLCYVASGRLDAYWATCVKVWDVAAGQLIVREAGGVADAPGRNALRPGPSAIRGRRDSAAARSAVEAACAERRGTSRICPLAVLAGRRGGTPNGPAPIARTWGLAGQSH